MDDDSLRTVVKALPEGGLCVVFGLAAVGLATVAYLFWRTLVAVGCCVPFFAYLTSSKRVMATAWLLLVAVAGGTAVGYSNPIDLGNMPFTGGVVALSLSFLILVFFWLRVWVKWHHCEYE